MNLSDEQRNGVGRVLHGAFVDYSKGHIDEEHIHDYNGRRSLSSKTRLQTHMPPSPFDGDPRKARIVLLLNNPTFGPNSSEQDHKLHFEGWPLAGLHPDAPNWFRNWYKRPLGKLIEEQGWQRVSQCVAIVQINPWASESFDLNCDLPSRRHQVDIAKQAAHRGAVVIIGRSVRFWQEQLGNAKNIHVAKNCRNPTLSKGELTQEAYKAVKSAFGSQ